MILTMAIIIIGLLLDRFTKLWAIASLKGTEGISVIKGFFTLDYLENRGAAFGMLQNKQWLFVIIAGAVIIFMVAYLIKKRPSFKLTSISMALIISGGIGNLIDRVYYNYVVDFIMLHYKDVYYFPTFNVADVLTCVGTFFLLICILKDEI